MSTSPPGRMRTALNLPSGSIRAVLSLAVLGISWLLVLFAPRILQKDGEVFQVPMVFVYLQFLMVLILGHYFTSRMTPNQETGRSSAAALWLPRGSVRFLILLAYGGLAYYLYRQGRDFTYEFDVTGNQILLISLMFGGFILGHYFTLVALWWLRPYGEIPGYILDIQAWLAILAMVGLLIVFLVHVVINPGVSPENRLNTAIIEPILAAIVGFYFGARS